jgi:hypothetical protein
MVAELLVAKGSREPERILMCSWASPAAIYFDGETVGEKRVARTCFIGPRFLPPSSRKAADVEEHVRATMLLTRILAYTERLPDDEREFAQRSVFS